ncbi:MAG: ABC transporter substrate-binding protein [Chloroflexi bacterium]|uniref:ABC transporter substrate-binding protein n=1 Tax=Candidatus Chlorohelix allophototropha TaxID=3003348 RepID=A0A8T7M5C3_9CHLR|nr:ABC transporter substrate-binding protein [Chloroflexota bacterium]WJW69192.1 ABC transporter substrate-binding protein [Chloroflexota bacterium L227-S17]
MSKDSMQNNETPATLLGGRYRLVRSLGNGSFGEVFQADDTKFSPPRVVAIKILKRQFVADPQIRNSIKVEAGILAQLHHPNILRVSDFEASDSICYIVTDLAEGGTLSAKLHPALGGSSCPLPLSEVANLLTKIAAALDSAHQKGLIHRDLKPANILLDIAGQPLIADFGLAAFLSGSASQVQSASSGTPLYMAPEQWNGKAGKSSDIYALGIITYQLITGQPPFQGNQEALAHQHLSSPLPKISEHAPGLAYPPMLDEILAKATAKDPHTRPESASAFALQFRAALENRKVQQLSQEKPTTPLAQLAAEAKTQSRQTEQVSSITPDKSPNGGKDSKRNGSPRLSGNAGGKPLFRRPITWISGVSFLVVSTIISLLVVNLFSPKVTIINNTTIININSPVLAISYSPDGKTIATASQDGVIRLVNVANGSVSLALQGQPGSASTVAISPDGQKLASGGVDSIVRIWRIADGTLLNEFKGHSAEVTSVAFSFDSLQVLSGSLDNAVNVWDLKNNNKIATLTTHSAPIKSVAFSPISKTFASASADKTVKIWKLNADNSGVLELNTIKDFQAEINAVEFSPDGLELATGGKDNTIKLWDYTVPGGKSKIALEGQEGSVTSLAYRGDGKTIASGSSDKKVRVWDAGSGKLLLMVEGSTDSVTSVAFSPDGNTVASGSMDKTIRLAEIASAVKAITAPPIPTPVASCILDGEVKIGALLPFTGNQGMWGKFEQQGAEMAIEDINASGLLGSKVKLKLVVEEIPSPDSGTQVQLPAYQKLVNTEKVTMLIDHGFINQTNASSFQDAVMVVVADNNPGLGYYDGKLGQNIFNNKISQTYITNYVVEQTKKRLGYQKVAFFYNDAPNYKAYVQDFQAAFQSKGVSVVENVSFKQGETDFNAALARIKPQNPEEIFIVASVDETVAIMKEARQLGFPWSVRFITSDLWDNPDYGRKGGAVADGSIFANSWFYMNAQVTNPSFVQRYQSKFGNIPLDWAANSYAAIQLLANAMKTSGSCEVGAVREALLKTKNLDTVLGTFSFDDKRNPIYTPSLKVLTYNQSGPSDMGAMTVNWAENMP